MKTFSLPLIIMLTSAAIAYAEPAEDTSEVYRWKSEVLTGKRLDTRPEPPSIFDFFRLTHEWEGAGDTRLRIWEAAGKWPGKFPVIAQLCDQHGNVLSAEELDLPAARPVRCWAFHRMGSHIVVNIECQHRHHPENGVYPFRVNMSNKVVTGGPVISPEVLESADKLLPDLIGVAKETKKAEQAGTGQPATRPESKLEGSDKPQPDAEGRSR